MVLYYLYMFFLLSFFVSNISFSFGFVGEHNKDWKHIHIKNTLSKRQFGYLLFYSLKSIMHMNNKIIMLDMLLGVLSCSNLLFSELDNVLPLLFVQNSQIQ
uniref:Uncharacterized protein n=1 Tax=Lactuca sativa TaxID=4236 RepID=A0A9R1WM58_LACSA|nr:hypothetical protein LSAT_V11C100020950 [Lactuca sativa]